MSLRMGDDALPRPTGLLLEAAYHFDPDPDYLGDGV